MASFSETWNALFESEPADNEQINLGANRIRTFKVDVRERMQIDHSWNGDGNDGKHMQATLVPLTVDPTGDGTGNGFVYAKMVGGSTELFYKDNNGNVLQLTQTGMVSSAFPSGTTIPFAQSTPPLGWVQLNISDVMLRVVNDTSGGAGGGSWVITGLNTSEFINIPVNVIVTPTGAGTVHNHVLLEGEIPTHTHDVTVGIGSGIVDMATGNTSVVGGSTVYTTDGGTGQNFGHNHDFSLNLDTVAASGSAVGGASGTAAGDGTWRPAYVNVMLARKA